MRSISRFGRGSGCWCQDLVPDPQLPVFKSINWFAKSIFWKQGLRQPGTGWSSAKTAREACHAGSERARERASRGKKKRQDLARRSQISFFCLLPRFELQERKPSWGTEKLRTFFFWFSNLAGFLSLLGCPNVVAHEMMLGWQWWEK